MTETLFQEGPMAIFGQVAQGVSQKVLVDPRVDVARPLRYPFLSMPKNFYGYVLFPFF